MIIAMLRLRCCCWQGERDVFSYNISHLTCLARSHLSSVYVAIVLALCQAYPSHSFLVL